MKSKATVVGLLVGNRSHSWYWSSFALEVSGLPGATARVAGIAAGPDDKPVVEVGQDQTREIRLSVQVGAAHVPQTSRDIEIAITDTAGGGHASARDHFIPGDQ